MTDPPDFLPSDVQLVTPPLTATLGNQDTEQAAALIIACLRASDNTWAPIRAKDMSRIIELLITRQDPLITAWGKNPFFSPDIGRLVFEGWAVKSGPSDDESLELTPRALEAIRSWVRKAS